jgi:hypothetical protein
MHLSYKQEVYGLNLFFEELFVREKFPSVFCFQSISKVLSGLWTLVPNGTEGNVLPDKGKPEVFNMNNPSLFLVFNF